MLKRLLTLALLVCVIVTSSEAQRRRGGGGGGGNLPPGIRTEGNLQERRDMMRAHQALPVADIWAELTLGMQIDPEKSALLKPILVEAYSQRRAALKEAREEKAWAFAKAQMRKLERELWPRINTVLSRREQRNLDRVLRR